MRKGLSSHVQQALEDAQRKHPIEAVVEQVLSVPHAWGRDPAWSAALMEEVFPRIPAFGHVNAWAATRLVQGLWQAAQTHQLRPLFFEEGSKVVPEVLNHDPATLVPLFECLARASRTRESFRGRFYTQVVDTFRMLSYTPSFEIGMRRDETASAFLAQMMRREEKFPERQSELATVGILAACAQEQEYYTFSTHEVRNRSGQTAGLAHAFAGALGADASGGFVCKHFLLSNKGGFGKAPIFVLLAETEDQTRVQTDLFCGTLTAFRQAVARSARRLGNDWAGFYTEVGNAAAEAMKNRLQFPSFIEAVQALPRLPQGAIRPY